MEAEQWSGGAAMVPAGTQASGSREELVREKWCQLL